MDNKYLITVLEASKRYGLGRDLLYRLIKSDSGIPFIKIGTKFLINTPLFEIWLNQATIEGRCF